MRKVWISISLTLPICILLYLLASHQSAENDYLRQHDVPLSSQEKPTKSFDEPVASQDQNSGAARVSSQSGDVFKPLDVDDVEQSLVDNFLSNRPAEAYRTVTFESDELRERMRSNESNGSFEIELFDREKVRLVADVADEYSSGWKTGLAIWNGTVEGQSPSSAIFTIAPDGTVDGFIQSQRHGLIKIDDIKGTGIHVMWRWDKEFTTKLD